MTDPTRIAYDPLYLTILAFLIEQPRHPYEIGRVIRERQIDFAVVPPRRLYHAIERLHQAGLVEPAETSREGKRPERTVYRITADGEEEFHAWLHELLTTPAREYPALMVALSFLPAIAAETGLHALQARATLLAGECASLRAKLAVLTTQLPRLVLLEIEYLLVLRQAELDWLQAVIADLRSGTLAWDSSPLDRNSGPNQQPDSSHP